MAEAAARARAETVQALNERVVTAVSERNVQLYRQNKELYNQLQVRSSGSRYVVSEYCSVIIYVPFFMCVEQLAFFIMCVLYVLHANGFGFIFVILHAGSSLTVSVLAPGSLGRSCAATSASSAACAPPWGGRRRGA